MTIRSVNPSAPTEGTGEAGTRRMASSDAQETSLLRAEAQMWLPLRVFQVAFQCAAEAQGSPCRSEGRAGSRAELCVPIGLHQSGVTGKHIVLGTTDLMCLHCYLLYLKVVFLF